jgi:serine/threonine protein kinase
VAVKELLMPALPAAKQDERLERARREAVNAARLDHPHVVTVHDVVIEDGEPWIVMQLVRGRSLREVLSESGRLEAEQVARIAEAVLSALRAAHEGDRQIVHRDVKPANILLADDGRTRRWHQTLTAKDPVLRPTAAQALAQLHGSYSEPRLPDGHRVQETVVFLALLVLIIAGYAWCEIRTRQGSSGNVSSHTPTSSAKPA